MAKILVGIVAAGWLIASAAAAEAQLVPGVCQRVREIPNPQLPDIAMASLDPMGVLIYYNPVVVQQSGPVLSAFFYAHEYGHICQQHVPTLLANPMAQPWLSPVLELQADCYAVQVLRNSNPLAIQSAYQRFMAQGPLQQVPTHPAGTVRAQNLLACLNGG